VIDRRHIQVSRVGRRRVFFVPERVRVGGHDLREGTAVEFILWVVAVILVIGGIVTMIRGAILYGLVLIVLGFLVGPGGVSIFT
jgi:hypothetical protein